MFNEKLNKEFGIANYKRYRAADLSCPCGCGEYRCSIDLVNVLKEIQSKVGDEDLEFGTTPCCDEYAYIIGEKPRTSPYTNGTAIEIYKPATISQENFEDILYSDDLGIGYVNCDDENELYYINLNNEEE